MTISLAVIVQLVFGRKWQDTHYVLGIGVLHYNGITNMLSNAVHSFPYTVERLVVERGVGRLGARGGA